MRKQAGFSLIELLIVVAVILIIAAIALPNMLRARAVAQEAAAVQTVRTIVTAEIAYLTRFPSCGYVGMTALGGDGSGPAAGGVLDNVFPDRAGYHFELTLVGTGGSCGITSGGTFKLQASPLHAVAGQRYFYSDPSAQIHYKYDSPASASDPILR